MPVPVSGRIDVRNQVFLITGAARGIGRATALSLVREGAYVTAFDILEGKETEKAFGDYGHAVLTVRGSVTEKQDLHDAVEQTLKTWGRIDGLVTAAGVVSRTNLEEMTLDEWNRVITVDLTGTFLAVQAVYSVFKKQRGGKIVCIGSIAGKVGGVISGPHYVAAKGGIHAFVKWVAKDGAAYGVYANAIAPGPVHTAMTENEPYTEDMSPLKRLGEPEDIAQAVLFLLSPASNWITGTVLDVNGGMLMD